MVPSKPPILMEPETAKHIERKFRPRVIRVPATQSHLDNPPLIRYYTYGEKKGNWELGEDVRISVEVLASPITIRIDAGYLFNLASIPRPVYPLIAPFELSVLAPLVHDFIYDHEGICPQWTVEPYRTFTRKEADILFLALMAKEQIPAWRRKPAYRAVRLFGSGRW